MPTFISLREAAHLLPHTERLLVVGCSGSGKSTLSKQITAKYDLNYISLDRDVRWLSGWQQREHQEQRFLINKIVEKDRWVIDGSSPSSFDLRLPRTQLVIWVRVPRYMSLAGVVQRVWRFFGTVRPEMAEGCPEKLPDREFLSYIWNFEKKHAPVFLKNLDLYGPQVPVIELKSRRQMDEFLTQANACAKSL